MPLTQNSAAKHPPAFELKGRMLTLSVLQLFSTDQKALATQLDARMASMPELFRHLPVVLDLEAVQGQALDLPALVDALRQRGLIPVGIRAVNAESQEQAVAAGLGVMNIGMEPARRAEPVQRPEAAAAAAPAAGAAMLVRQPVRSGQQIYARGGDLVVMAPVSAGAEVLADGHIHIYGPLRGRALAGVQGDTQARIFCQSLEAELVSIAGAYRISENIQETGRRQPVQIYLDGEALCIEPL
jgi:septum site-determining protein MinC